ncbi:zinc finger BED domain-containing protein 5-like [Aphis gossypii]|uniref:zinc finger BED domain-containing protein 5-like n=1 Tax=Aphis gossypii TaxID=80765 RepID=UPI002158C583|nr:zinc finger BED domain-containing protein 5-like [Aphis gossypii]
MDRWLKGGHFNKKPVTEESLSTQSVEGRINDENGSQVVHHCNSNANGFINPIKKRKYNESYLEIGFSETNDCQPQCVICLKNHPDYEGKKTDYFKRKRTELLAVQNKIKTHVQTDNENALRASYMVRYRIAQKGEAHTIAETLIKPCLIDIATCMLEEKFAKQLSTIPLSNNTVARRIADLATNVEQTLVSIIKYRKFALQMDKSTDVAGLAILLVFVRYENIHSFEEDLLFCRPLLSNTTGVQIFG